MATALYVEAVDWPAAAVIPFFRWRNLPRLAGPGGLFTRVEYQQPDMRIGATRLLWMESGPPVRERLDFLDDEGGDYFAFRYRVLDVGPLPVTDYVGDIAVTAAGPDRCVLRFRCDYVPVGIGEEQWTDFYITAEKRLLAAVKERLHRGETV
ncbi:hypothetical protein Swit_0671 [Rhizorhabdus wittichii RW1]|jgi:hypothetical protein|uniref:SRPBCC family protein n=1 Tax=Rhizorhabdus wittichii (strain DSM 6014 / CCUG 31198 / JCM 15750 / NBRC 105917 / EY 4224 / RW1) TaxID=392499 RepID=A0A9J9LCV8_RHIWR|nr:hypothetical protein Swit_0671 [Rhizorhabdus wittichii RW1]